MKTKIKAYALVFDKELPLTLFYTHKEATEFKEKNGLEHYKVRRLNIEIC